MSKKMFQIALIGTAAVALLSAPLAFAGPVDSGKSGRAIYDFNGDGKSDIAATKVSGNNVGLVRILKVDGANPLIGSSFPTVVTNGFAVSGAGDFTGNGQAGLFTRKASGTNTGIAKIVNLDAGGDAPAGSEFVTVPTNFSLVGIDDVDNNGVDDLIYIKTAGGNEGLLRVYLMDTDSTVLVSVFPTVIPTAFSVIGVGDVNGDGTADILAEKVSGNNVGLLRAFLLQASGSGASTVISVLNSTFPGVRNPDFDILGVAYNNQDERADIITIKASGNNLGLLRARLFGADAAGFDGTVFPFLVPAAWTIEGIGNYNGSDQQDIFARKTSGGNEGLLRVWELNAAGDGVALSGFPGNLDVATFEIDQTEEVLP